MADITGLQNQYKNLSSTLQSSPTAYSGDAPSAGDMSTQRKMMALNTSIERAKSANLSTNYYGDQATAAPDDSTTGVKSKGVIGRALQVLGAGVTLPVGAIEALTGKGTKKGVLENMGANFQEGEGYGDLLRKFGVNNTVSTVAGFGMDVALDPVNWATAGTAALIPRVGEGLLKGGLEGAGKGLLSGALEKAAILAKPLKWVGATEKYAGLVKAGAEATAGYEKAIGFDLAESLAKGSPMGNLLGNAIEGVKDSPVGNMAKQFLYSTTDWMKKSKAIDDLRTTAKTIREWNPDVLKQTTTEKALALLDNPDLVKSLQANKYDLRAAADKRVTQMLADGHELATLRPDLGTFANKDEAVKAFWDEGVNDLAVHESAAALQAAGISNEEALGYIRASKDVANDATGVGWFDKAGAAAVGGLNNLGDQIFKTVSKKYNIGDVKMGNKIMDGYDFAISLFKRTKVGSPSTIAYSAAGNWMFRAMAGLDNMSGSFYKTLKEGYQWAKGKPTLQSMMEMMDNPSVRELVEKYPQTFQKTFGFNPKLFINNDTFQQALNEYTKLKGIGISDETRAEITKAFDQFGTEWNSSGGLKGQIGKQAATEAMSPLEQGLKATAGDIPVPFDTSGIAKELDRGGINKWINNLKDAGAGKARTITKIVDGKKVVTQQPISAAEKMYSQVMSWYLTKPIEAFEKVDQTYKIANFIQLTRDGVTQNELRNLGRTMGKLKLGDIAKGDDVAMGADGLFRFSADKAMDISNEIYMNYSAMPGAVKVMRQMPFLGSPFFSFTYAMGAKTGKTFINNPGLLNKVQFALKELNGGKSPLEKNLLANSPNYQWYNQDGMLSLPFMRDNPLYINLANFIPYYTMNIFQPSNRTYTKNLQGGVAQAIDSIPFFKTPEGQVFVDYFLMPHLMQQTNPEGSFGQALYPSNASGLEKNLLYPIRGLAESVLPPFASSVMAAPIAAVADVAKVPDSWVGWMPSYQARSLTYATRGKSSLGILSTVPANANPYEKTAFRAAAIYAGLNLYKMNLNQSVK